MPPKKGIVSSGNAGNSSKANKKANNTPPADEAGPSKPPPLFPPGSKYPLSLLNERCQKNGWSKANVDTKPCKGGFSFSVVLSKVDKSGNRETVRFEPDSSYVCPTAPEARQWGATYALYRFCNGIQLNRVLPPGPREYWQQLAKEHSENTPEHKKWMYESDPFEARKALEAKRAKANAKKQEAQADDKDRRRPPEQNISPEFANAPEVKMATNLRELVEASIKKAFTMYPEADDTQPSSDDLNEKATSQVTSDLGLLGFTVPQQKKAIAFLSENSALASALLGNLTPLEAAIEFLVLNVPEVDLPERFLPQNNSSNSFVTSAHTGTDDLRKRWAEDKAIKQAGWPAHAVKQLTRDPTFVDTWEHLIRALGKKLLGLDTAGIFTEESPDSEINYTVTEDEVDAMGVSSVSDAEPPELVMPMFTAPIELHVLCEAGYSSLRCPTMFITSKTVPAYVRLHLLGKVLRAIEDGTLIEPGEGLFMACMRVLEDEWAVVQSQGPPEMVHVLQHLMPPKSEAKLASGDGAADSSAPKAGNKRREGGQSRGIRSKQDDRTDAQVQVDFDSVRSSSKYVELLKTRERLPAFKARKDFLEMLDRSRVVVVVGETGCGKTTQWLTLDNSVTIGPVLRLIIAFRHFIAYVKIPQFILDSMITNGRGSTASILVTQPRRLSAMSVSARVSAERTDDGSVGYAIRGESNQTHRTKILFCTTGVALRRITSGDKLNNVTHVIVDEVHERSIDGDFLLLELRELLKVQPTLKVILMSATINHQAFIDYFDRAPLLTIPGFSHPVTDLYLEDVISKINYKPVYARMTRKEDNEKNQKFFEEYEKNGLDEEHIRYLHAIVNTNRLDYQLLATVVAHITETSDKKGGILIFLSGVQEIRQCIEAIRSVTSSSNVALYPLHANLSSDEQREVFKRTSKWKIIAATNVAETSITIDDVICVVDTGRVKETRYDPDTGLSRLSEVFTTRAAGRQRRGRAGRNQPGTCYKLYTRTQEAKFGAFPIPEMLRAPLESISLAVKVSRESEDVQYFLSRAISPPKVSAMEKAWSILEDLGAVDYEGELTALGRNIALLPVDLRLAKMLILGAMFSCLNPIVTITSILSSKPLFLNPMDKRDEANKARMRFASAGSDLLTDLEAFETCERLYTEGKCRGAVKSFCEENFISFSSLQDITSLRGDFLTSLSDIGFIPMSTTLRSPSMNKNSGNVNLVKSIIVGGLWPRITRVHLPKSAIKFDKIQAGTIQRENEAKDFRLYDLQGGRVFLHPGSVLFDVNVWKSPFLVYFSKFQTAKVFLRDASEVPMYALLLFGGPVMINHVGGGLVVGTKDSVLRLRAWPRIGILVNQLRRLLDAQMLRCVDEGTVLDAGPNNPVIEAMIALLANDGLSE